MFGSVGAWFYSHLAGLELQGNMLLIRPRMLSEGKKHLMAKLDCQLSTLYGLVHVSYTRDERDTFANTVLLRVSIPSNAQAEVIFEPLFPGARCMTLTDDGRVIWSSQIKASNVVHDSRTGFVHVRIGSGQYEFQAFWE